MPKSKILLLAFLISFLTACFNTQNSLLIADDYSEKKDLTTLTIIPYGEIDIPGKWVKVYYNENSRQHYFRNADSVSIAVTKNPVNKYAVYEKGIKDLDFSNAWFNWEADYYREKGYTIKQLNQDKEDDFVLWKASAERTDNIFLYGVKKKMAYNLASVDDRWPEEKRIAFLVSLWEKN